MPITHDCIVVGAGFSGLTAACELQRAGLDVLCLEARDRVGGRTEAGMLAGLTIDLGGMWLGPTQERLAALAEAYQLRTYATPLSGRGRVGIGRTDASVDGEAFHEALPEAAMPDFIRALDLIAHLSAPLDTGSPWAHPQAHALDALTVAHWMEVHALHPAVRDLLSVVCQSVLCAESSELSLLFFLFYMKGGGSIETMISAGPGGAQNFLFHGGVHQIATRLAGELGLRLKLSEVVQSVSWSDQVCEVATGTSRYFGRKVIFAVPPGPLLDIRFSPALPPAKRALLKRQPMGACIKCWIAYERPFWRAESLNGLILDTRAQFTPVFDATPPGSPLGILAGFFDADAAVTAAQLMPQDRREIVIKDIARHFGSAALNPIDYAERDWTGEVFSQGCYGAFMGPGTLTKFGKTLRQSIGPLHWAGTETSTIWSGYIDGAIRAGERAAQEVIGADLH